MLLQPDGSPGGEDLGGVAATVEAPPEGGEILLAPQLACLERNREARNREGRLDGGELLAFALGPAREESVARRLGQHAVHEHCVGGDSVEREVGEGAPGLGDYESRRIHDQACRRTRAVDQNTAHRVYVGDEALDGVEDGFVRNDAVGVQALQQGSHHASAPALHLEEVIHEEPQRVGETQHAQGRSG